jgi:flagellar basal-body rod protein FlgB
MSNPLFNDSTMQGLQYALNSLTQRQQVLGNNVANAQTPGFVAQDVSFEDQLASILNGTGTGMGTNANTGMDSNTGLSVSNGQPRVINAPDLSSTPDGNTVSLESQMAKVSETNVMYDALTQLTADRMGILNTAITG